MPFMQTFTRQIIVLIQIIFQSSRNQEGLCHEIWDGQDSKNPGILKKNYDNFFPESVFNVSLCRWGCCFLFSVFCHRLNYIVLYLQVSIITSFTKSNTKTIPCEPKICRTNLFCCYCLPSLHTSLSIHKPSPTVEEVFLCHGMQRND